jgi:hypothetical protein
LFTSVVDTGNKFIASAVVTCDNCLPLSLILAKKFIIGVVVTGDYFLVVSTTQVINLSPISTTPPIKENP